MYKSLTASYVLFIGFIIGIEFAAGALLAPVVFYPAQFIGEGVLSHLQSGMLMSQVFLRYNIILLIFVAFAWGYEVYALFIKQKDLLSIALIALISVGAFLFVFYFTPFIMQAQKGGEAAIKTAEFNAMHKGSEFDMKFLMICQLTLFFRRVWLLLDRK